MQNDSAITLFLVATTVTIALLAGLTITLIYLYKKKQLLFHQKLETLKLDYEKSLITIQLEIQEDTFQNISREIHDNITPTLTLAKLNLNTLNLQNTQKSSSQVFAAVELLSKSIQDLSNTSKSMNSEIINSYGLIRALEREVNQINNIGLFTVDFLVTGESEYMETQKELIVFRIIQEGFNNIIKYANANHTLLKLHYEYKHLHLSIIDDGIGFLPYSSNALAPGKAGLKNMALRVKMIGGTMKIDSKIGHGTKLLFTIPL